MEEEKRLGKAKVYINGDMRRGMWIGPRKYAIGRRPSLGAEKGLPIVVEIIVLGWRTSTTE